MSATNIMRSAVLLISFSGAEYAQDFSSRGQMQPQPAPEVNEPRSPQAQCLSMIYKRYLSRGLSAQNAWNNALRDCGSGIDLSCMDLAYRHYLSQGQRDSQAYNNAMRDCRSLSYGRW